MPPPLHFRCELTTTTALTKKAAARTQESDPLDLRDAHRPVDEVAGTGVNTFSYCVERSDGIFYPSRVPGSLQFGSDMGTPDNPHTNAITFHAWDSMRSLAARGLDPLKVRAAAGRTARLLNPPLHPYRMLRSKPRVRVPAEAVNTAARAAALALKVLVDRACYRAC